MKIIRWPHQTTVFSLRPEETIIIVKYCLTRFNIYFYFSREILNRSFSTPIWNIFLSRVLFSDDIRSALRPRNALSSCSSLRAKLISLCRDPLRRHTVRTRAFLYRRTIFLHLRQFIIVFVVIALVTNNCFGTFIAPFIWIRINFKHR